MCFNWSGYGRSNYSILLAKSEGYFGKSSNAASNSIYNYSWTLSVVATFQEYTWKIHLNTSSLEHNSIGQLSSLSKST